MSLVMKPNRWLFVAAHAALALSLTQGCSSPDSSSTPPSGPPMGIVEVDPRQIPLGENDPSRGGSNSTGGGNSAGSVGTAGSGTQPKPGVMLLGKPCETSSDCPSGQTCHMDPDFIAHKQCTVGCEADETCEAIEKGAFCIGANVCVHGCTTDADCGPKTRCGKSDWCERSGPGSGVPYCGGLATPCALLSGGLACTAAFGCRDNSRCNGVAESCYSQFSSFSCTSQDGCFWSSSSKSCSGSSHSCLGYTFDFDCTDQQGCNWSPNCTGTPQACDDTPVALCTEQPGCTVLQD